MKRQRSFTLIELLVVVSIIAILAAMLLPALTRARQVAQGTYCLNNLKQLYLSAIMYADDWNEVLPHSGAPSYDNPGHRYTSNPDNTRWWQRMEGYEKGKKSGTIFHCPNTNGDLQPRQGMVDVEYAMPNFLADNTNGFNYGYGDGTTGGKYNDPLPTLHNVNPNSFLFSEPRHEANVRPFSGGTNSFPGPDDIYNGGPYFWRINSKWYGSGHAGNAANLVRVNGSAQPFKQSDVAGEWRAAKAEYGNYWSWDQWLHGGREMDNR